MIYAIDDKYFIKFLVKELCQKFCDKELIPINFEMRICRSIVRKCNEVRGHREKAPVIKKMTRYCEDGKELITVKAVVKYRLRMCRFKVEVETPESGKWKVTLGDLKGADSLET